MASGGLACASRGGSEPSSFSVSLKLRTYFFFFATLQTLGLLSARLLPSSLLWASPNSSLKKLEETVYIQGQTGVDKDLLSPGLNSALLTPQESSFSHRRSYLSNSNSILPAAQGETRHTQLTLFCLTYLTRNPSGNSVGFTFKMHPTYNYLFPPPLPPSLPELPNLSTGFYSSISLLLLVLLFRLLLELGSRYPVKIQVKSYRPPVSFHLTQRKGPRL